MLSSCLGLCTPMQMSTVSPPIVRRRSAPRAQIRFELAFFLLSHIFLRILCRYPVSGLCAELERCGYAALSFSGLRGRFGQPAGQSVLLAGLLSQRLVRHRRRVRSARCSGKEDLGGITIHGSSGGRCSYRVVRGYAPVDAANVAAER